MRAYEAIAGEIARQGVTAVFGLMSEETAKLTLELEKHDIAYYSTRHETLAVGMADGYARAGGGVSVAIVGRGPSFTNALTGAITAAKAASSVVLLVGDGHSDGDPTRALHPKYVDQIGVLRAAGVETARLGSGCAAALTAEVFDRARTGMTVALDLPDDLLERPEVSKERTPEPTRTEPARPDPNAISLVADLLEESWAAQHPLILAGRGAAAADAKADLERIGEACGALLGCTLQARQMFAGNAFDAGVIGTYSSEATIELAAQADLVLAFGASLNPFTTGDGDMFPNTRVIHVDRDGAAFGRYPPIAPELGIEADAGLTARALADELERRGLQSAGFRTEAVAERLAAARVPEAIADRGGPGAVDPRLLMQRLDAILPQDRLLVVDAGHHSTFSLVHLDVPGPRDCLYPVEFFCVGAGVGVALGAAVACAPRPVVLCTGDGALMMALADLHTAVRYRLPLVVIVNNDSAFGSEVHYLQIAGLPDAVARHPNPSFEAVAKAIGADGVTVESLDDLELLKGRLDGISGPLLVDCKITTDVRAEPVEHYFSLAHARSLTVDG